CCEENREPLTEARRDHLRSGFAAVFQLTLVFDGVEVAERLRDEAVSAKTPLFKAANANAAASPARTIIGPEERPVVFGAVAVDEAVVHEHLQVRKGVYELLSRLRDGSAAYGGSGAVYAEGAFGGIEACDARRVVTAPRGGITLRKVAHTRLRHHKLGPFSD